VDRSATYDFLLTFQSNHVTMGLSRSVSEINVDFSRKSQFFHPVYLELGIGAKGSKTTMIELPDGRKSFKICFAV